MRDFREICIANITTRDYYTQRLLQARFGSHWKTAEGNIRWLK